MIDAVISILSLLTLFAHIGLAAYILLFLSQAGMRMTSFISKHAIRAAASVAALATAGSLFFSLVAGFAPCELCWYQRIFMYPLVVLFGLAWKREERIIFRYAWPLVSIGWLISVYHNFIYYRATHSDLCSLDSTTSCIAPYFTKFGYIGIPIMSLTAFTLIGIILISAYRRR